MILFFIVINKVYLCNPIKKLLLFMQIPIEALNLLMLNVGYANHNADWNWKNVYSPFTRIPGFFWFLAHYIV